MTTPDYEAAAVAFIEKLKEIAPNNTIIALDVDMRMIVAAVDAALGDEPLYEIDWTAFDARGLAEAQAALTMNTIVQVWPKGTDG